MKNKKTILSLILLPLVLSGCFLFKNKVVPYSFDTAKIILTLKGNLVGTSTIYYKDDKFRKETSIQKTLPDGTKQNVDTLYISTGDTNYQVDLDTKTAIVSKNQQYEDLKAMSKDKRTDYLNKIALGGTFASATPTGKLTIAGQDCDLYKVGGNIEACLWNGIVIEEKFSIPAINLTSEVDATSIEKNIPLADDLFVLPKDVKIQ